MQILVDENDPRPICRQIVDEIRTLIACKELRAGDPLPQVRRAKTGSAINLNTLAIAYTELYHAELIEDYDGRARVAQHRYVKLLSSGGND